MGALLRSGPSVGDALAFNLLPIFLICRECVRAYTVTVSAWPWLQKWRQVCYIYITHMPGPHMAVFRLLGDEELAILRGPRVDDV